MSFNRPSPTLVLQTTNAGTKKDLGVRLACGLTEIDLSIWTEKMGVAFVRALYCEV